MFGTSNHAIKDVLLYSEETAHDTRASGMRQAADGPSRDNGERKAPPGK
jgi:hypothetical protein